MAHYVFIEDEKNDLVDIIVLCDFCGGGNNWPGGIETDYDQFCDTCGELVRHGIESTES